MIASPTHDLFDELADVNGPVRPSLLVVDDDPSVRHLLAVILADDYDVMMCDGGPEALAAIDTGVGIDLAILDVMMPDVDGFAVAERLVEVRAGVPIVMLTALTDMEARNRADRIGVDCYLTKPFDPGVLTASIDMLLALPATQTG